MSNEFGLINCYPAGRPNLTYSAASLADLRIGESRPIPKGCTTVTDWNLNGMKEQGLVFPETGEFDTFLEGDCGYCTNAAGCECKPGVIGRRGNLRRRAYTANPAACCINQHTKTIGNRTCDPRFSNSYTTGDCDADMLQYCSNPPKTWDTNECRSWVAAAVQRGRPAANTAMADFCSIGQNLKKPVCQSWCRGVKNFPSTQTLCDDVIQSYCLNTPGDTECACLRPPENVTRAQELISASKKCWYAPCNRLSDPDFYMTKSLQNEPCPLTQCIINTGDITTEGTDNKLVFQNNCATEIIKPEFRDQVIIGGQTDPTEQGQETLPPSLPPTEDTPSTQLPPNTIFSAISGSISIFIVIIILIFFFIFASR